MGKYFIAVCFIFCVIESSAQRRTIFSETFNDNTNEWTVGESEDGTVRSEVSDGLYRVRLNAKDRWQYYSQPVTIDRSENFRISARFRQVAGSDDSPFGFVFQTSDADNNYHFLIRSSKSAKLSRYKEGAYEDILEWTDRSNVKPKGEWNTLEIVRENDALACFVNGQYAGGFSYSFYRVFGDKVGIFVWDEIEVEMDDLQIQQWSMQNIDVVQGTDSMSVPVNLGPGINSTHEEIVDCLSPDGSMMMLNRKFDEQNVGDKDYSDIYVSYKTSDGTWKKATNVGTPLNTPSNNFSIALTQDLNTLFVQGVYKSDGTSTSRGLSYATRTKDGWSRPVEMPIDDFYNYSDIYNNSHISPDGTVLLYSLERADSRGGTDLYVCFRKPNDMWTAPKNLGDVINTQGFDTGPFITADGKTMYYSSNGLPGYEGMDVFVTTRLDDTWLNWSKPKNLGRPINTDENDVFFQVPARGDSGYYSSTKNSMGRYDIFSIALPKGARPEAVILVKGRVLNAVTKEPLEADVVYESLSGLAKSGKARSNSTDGTYRAALTRGELYGVHADVHGFYPLSEQFDARNLDSYIEIERDLYLNPIALNMPIRLNNVFFDFGKYELRPESYPELDRLAEFLKQNPKVMIELSGHTDNVGSDKDNLVLSQNRINSVKSRLEQIGITGGRMTARGYGEAKPVAINDSEEGRQKNRRVEFTILQK